MQEQYLDFTSARLAKSVGFDWGTRYYYDEMGDTGSGLGPVPNWNKSETLVSKPTQAHLQKWLRDVHHIDISIFIRGAAGYELHVHHRRAYRKDYEPLEVHPTVLIFKISLYEQALEAGLNEALTILQCANTTACCTTFSTPASPKPTEH